MRHGRAVGGFFCLQLVALAFAARAVAASSGALDASVEGSLGLIDVHSAAVRTPGIVAVSAAIGSYEAPDPDDDGHGPLRCGSLKIAGSAGLLPWLEVSLDAAAVLAMQEGTDGDVIGLSHPALGVKVGGAVADGRLFLALEGRAELPSGSDVVVDRGGGDELLTGGDADASVAALATADLGRWLPMRLHANAGWIFHGNGDRGRALFPGTYPPIDGGGEWSDNDALLLRGAVEFVGRRVGLFTEFRGDLLHDEGVVALKENPLLVTPGVRWRFGSWAATAAFSVGISGNDRSTPEFDPHGAYPDWMLTASVSWGWPAFAADTDGDGTEDFRDACPSVPEDPDGHLDGDGCPDPDDDGDGVPDELDLDPASPEDVDGFEDEDGVPDFDNDGDGIIDSRDMCPDEGEDLDAFEDGDGCPDR